MVDLTELEKAVARKHLYERLVLEAADRSPFDRERQYREAELERTKARIERLK